MKGTPLDGDCMKSKERPVGACSKGERQGHQFPKPVEAKGFTLPAPC